MHVLLGIALKSLLVAGLTLGSLQLMRRRSAAERSWVAHTGLLALLIMALAPVALPRWTIETPSILEGGARASTPTSATLPAKAAKPRAVMLARSTDRQLVDGQSRLAAFGAGAAVTAVYAIPAAILLLITLLALIRLIALRARADVLVDGHWLSALARAQRRMGFKHGTALLTSDELASPISWGLVRPVILLNNRAVEASGEAEAIIAHELAHVARMDWIKLLLARLTTALFWFNPFVWLLAREAHQLREEAADDSVLASDIVDTDYAQLLVGVARHECPGLLLGAHGVAPSKSSLARRVARVLDSSSVRGPVAGSFALGVLAGALIVAAPLAALTLAPAAAKAPATGRPASASQLSSVPSSDAQDEPTDLPRIIAKGVSTSLASATAAISPHAFASAKDFTVAAPEGAKVSSHNDLTIASAPDGASVTLYPPDADGRRRVVALAPNGARAVSYADADAPHLALDARVHQPRDESVDNALAMKAVGMTPEFVRAMRSASPALRNATADELYGLTAVGATPEYVRGLANAGYGNLGVSELEEARAVGLTADYMRAIRATGVNASISDLVELRALGVRPDELARIRQVVSGQKRQVRRGEPPQPPSPAEDDK